MSTQNFTDLKIYFIGGGRMARALLLGLQAKSFPMPNVTVCDTGSDPITGLDTIFELERVFAGIHVTKNLQLDSKISRADMVVLAVKPQQMLAVCKDLAGKIKNNAQSDSDALLVSIAAGLSTRSLAEWTQHEAIVRAMPNTPAQIGQGMSALYASPRVSQAQGAHAQSLFDAVGKTLWLNNEAQMDAVTAISGSGPAFVFYWMEALIASAIAQGLSADDATFLVQETFLGAALLAKQSGGKTLQQLREAVTSPGGTTAAGVQVLENKQVKAIVSQACEAAVARARELGAVK